MKSVCSALSTPVRSTTIAAATLCVALGLWGCASTTPTEQSRAVTSDPPDAIAEPTPDQPATNNADSSAAGTASVETEVLGISIRTSAIGQISIAHSSAAAGVELAVLNAQVDTEDTSASIALAQHGEIVASTRVVVGERVDLSVVEPGVYEVWAVGTGPEVTAQDGTLLAGAQTVERVGDIRIE